MIAVVSSGIRFADKVSHWHEKLTSLAEVAKSQTHAAYTAFTHGFVHKFSFLSRTILHISPLLQPLEDRIRHRLIPALTGRPPPNDSERELLALPVRLGGLGIVNPTLLPNTEYQASVEVTAPLKDLILKTKRSSTLFSALMPRSRPKEPPTSKITNAQKAQLPH